MRIEFTEATDHCDLEEGEAGVALSELTSKQWDRPCDLLQLGKRSTRGERLGDREHGVANFSRWPLRSQKRQKDRSFGVRTSEKPARRICRTTRTLRAAVQARCPIGIDSGYCSNAAAIESIFGWHESMKTNMTHRAGQIGRPFRALATSTNVLQGCDRQLSVGRNPVGASLPSWTEMRARLGGCRRRKGWDIVLVTVPLKTTGRVPVEPLAGKVRDRHNNYYPTRRPHPRAHNSRRPPLRSPAGALTDPRRSSRHSTTFTRLSSRPDESGRARTPAVLCHSWRRSGCEARSNGAASTFGFERWDAGPYLKKGGVSIVTRRVTVRGAPRGTAKSLAAPAGRRS